MKTLKRVMYRELSLNEKITYKGKTHRNLQSLINGKSRLLCWISL